LLVAYNITTTDKTVFEMQRSGFYMVGKADDKTCIDGKDTSISSNLDSTIKFGVDSTYGCTKNMTVSEYTTFCLEKQWKNLKIFNFPIDIQYIGMFGNAQINFLKVFL
jgi:hypothetical protein